MAEYRDVVNSQCSGNWRVLTQWYMVLNSFPSITVCPLRSKKGALSMKTGIVFTPLSNTSSKVQQLLMHSNVDMSRHITIAPNGGKRFSLHRSPSPPKGSKKSTKDPESPKKRPWQGQICLSCQHSSGSVSVHPSSPMSNRYSGHAVGDTAREKL